MRRMNVLTSECVLFLQRSGAFDGDSCHEDWGRAPALPPGAGPRLILLQQLHVRVAVREHAQKEVRRFTGLLIVEKKAILTLQ